LKRLLGNGVGFREVCGDLRESDLAGGGPFGAAEEGDLESDALERTGVVSRVVWKMRPL